MAKTPLTTEQRILKTLRRKKEKRLSEIADELGVSVKSIVKSISTLVASDLAIRHEGRPPTYTLAD